MELPLFHVTRPPLEKDLPQPQLLTTRGWIRRPPRTAKALALCQFSVRPHLRHWQQHCSRGVPKPDQLQDSAHSLSRGIFF